MSVPAGAVGRKKTGYKTRYGFHITREQAMLSGQLLEESIKAAGKGANTREVEEAALNRVLPKGSKYYSLLTKEERDPDFVLKKYQLSRIGYFFKGIKLENDTEEREFHIVPVTESSFEPGRYERKSAVLRSSNKLDAISQRYLKQVVGAAREIRSLGIHEEYPVWGDIVNAIEQHKLHDW